MMKKGIVLVAVMLFALVARPCSCPDEFFCSMYDQTQPNSIAVYGYKVADLSTNGITFKVLDSWGAGGNITADTINIWNDSLEIHSNYWGPDSILFQCSEDTRSYIYTTDTFLILVKPHYAGAGYSAPGDYIFYQDLCVRDLLKVSNGVVEDTHLLYLNIVMEIINEPIDTYKNRLVSASGCTPTSVINTVAEKSAGTHINAYVTGKQLHLSMSSSDKLRSLYLYNTAGQQVYTAPAKRQHDLSALPGGIYILNLQGTNGSNYRQKIWLPD